MLDPIAFGKDMGELIRSTVQPLKEQIANLKAHADALEKRLADIQSAPGEKGADGLDGAPGKDGVGIESASINEAGELELAFADGTVKSVGRVVGSDGANGADGRDGIDGKDGADGRDADPVELSQEDIAAALKADPAFMREIVASYLKENPPPAGQDGRDGLDGKDADPVEIEQDDIVRALKSDPAFLREIVADYLKENPPPSGKDGRDGIDGKDGEKGGDGKDGVGMTGAMIDKSGELIVTLSDGTLQRCGEVVGKDGAPGRDGVDLSDIDFEYDGERGFTLKAKGGQIVKSYTLPVVIDKGYWREGCKAETGDAYTHDGSLWIARKATTEKPSAQAKDDWRLAVRKGRDAAPAKSARIIDDKPISLRGQDNA